MSKENREMEAAKRRCDIVKRKHEGDERGYINELEERLSKLKFRLKYSIGARFDIIEIQEIQSRLLNPKP